MANNNTKNSLSRVTQIFNDLDKYRDFCRDYGYRFDESDLYNHRTFVYRQYQRFVAGKPAKDQWQFDYTKWRERDSSRSRG